MRNKYLNIFVIILLFSSVAGVFAGPKNKYGLSAATELLIPVGSKATALAGSNMATVTGLEAIYWNPSGLSTLSGKTGEAMFSNQIYIADIGVNYFAGAYQMPNVGTFALSLKALSFGDIEITTVGSPNGTGETYSPTFLITGLSYARDMTDRISFGTTAKIIYNKITAETATGLAFDFGLNYKVTGSGLSFGVALMNLGPSMTFTGQDLEQFYQPSGTISGTPSEPRMTELADFELPTALSLGLSYDFRLDKTNSLLVHGTFQNNSFSTDDYNLGLEYSYNKLVYLRAGYQITDDPYDQRVFTGGSFGAGFNYNASASFNIGFDYAYRVTENFDANQYFTILMGF